MRLLYTNLRRGALATLLLAASLPLAQAIDPPGIPGIQAQKLAPYVTSPQPIVEKMLEVARLKSGETIYDLGCGDGRILFSAVKNFGAKAVGVEISPTLAKRAQQTLESQGMQDQVKVIQADMMSVDVSGANVVSLYLMTDANEALRPKLERELKAGARVVSLEFKIKGWKAAREETVQVHNHPYKIYLYEVPKK
ncbi:MAG TPA: class I SAM-dependent methyltransferase [Paludibaculum sp.]|jgi:ubiquinone/menaquinone biosynthesis C-methylase UbiE